MSRRYSKSDELLDLSLKTVGIVLLMFVIYAGSEYKNNRVHFWQIIMYMFLFTIASFGLIIGFQFLKYKIIRKKSDRLMSQISKAGLEEYINNFIKRFGLERGRNKGMWSFRGHSFDWDRLNDFRKVLLDKGVKVSESDYKDIDFILREYI
jgi:general stress protein CsbA